METPSPEPSRLDVLQSTPSPTLRGVRPLRIIKRRSNSNCGNLDGYSGDQSARKFSQETEESRGSVPELPDEEKQLMVPKIRGHRNSQIFDPLDDVQEETAPLGHELYTPRGLYCNSSFMTTC